MFLALEEGGVLWKLGTPLHWILKEVLSVLNHSDVHVFVAHFVKSFDTVDRRVLDYVLGRLGLPVWFRRTYFGHHAKFVCGLGSPWTRDGGIAQECPLSKVFIVA